MPGLALWTILLSQSTNYISISIYIANILGSTRFHEQTKLLLCIFFLFSKEFGITVLTWPAENTEVKVGSLRLPPPQIHN